MKIQTASGSFVDSLADGKETMDEEEQKELISSMDIPDLLQKGITENNTALVYQYLAVNTFAGYISGYLANVAVNCLSFGIIHTFLNPDPCWRMPWISWQDCRSSVESTK